MLGRVCLSLLVLVSVALPAGAAPPAPAVAFEAQAVAVTGATPWGKVVLFGVAREIGDHSATVVRRDQVLADDDGDGAVRLDLEKPVPPISVWIAVDLTSGVWAIGEPEGSTASEIPIANRNPGHEAGQADWVETGRFYLEMATVRPGQGAWAATLGDGGRSDADGVADGRITAALSGMRPVGESPAAPDLFSAHDVVAVVDPNRMELYVEAVSDAP